MSHASTNVNTLGVVSGARFRHTEGMSTTARLGSGVVLASLLVLTACGSESPGPLDGDCNARIRFQNHVFRPHNLVDQSLQPADATLGSGDVVGCDLESVDQVDVHRVPGVDPGLAVAVVDQDWYGIYVREGSRPRDWPSQLTAAKP